MKMATFKEVKKSLIKIRGIGPWTAHYVLMRCLRFPNAFPIDNVELINSTLPFIYSVSLLEVVPKSYSLGMATLK